jgi:hypothetical protein
MVRITKQSGLIMAAGITLALAGCSDSDGDGEISASASADGRKVSASVDPATAQLALDELSSNVDITITGFSDSSTAPTGSAAAAPAIAAPGTASTLSVKCSAGGDAMVDGYVNVVPLPVDVDVKVAITYNGCVTNGGTTIKGDIDFSQSVAAGPGLPLRVETIYTGDVELSGRVNAKCPVDLNVLVDETGRAIQVSGQFCGREASALNLQISPRWGAQ